MQVLVINGSARKSKGVTQRLADALCRGLENSGAEVDLVHAAEIKAAPCVACLKCMHRTPGKCAQDDGMSDIYPKLQAADMLVLAAPVYTDNMSAQLKAMIDRCICSMQPFLRKDDAGRVRHPFTWRMPAKWVLVSTAGFPEPETFAGLITTVRAQAANFGCEVAAEFCVPGSIALQMEPAALEPHLDLLTRAGQELAADQAVSDDLAKAINTPPLSVERYLELAARYEAWAKKSLAGSEPLQP